MKDVYWIITIYISIIIGLYFMSKVYPQGFSKECIHYCSTTKCLEACEMR